MKNVVILGGGVAGTTAAEELRKRSQDVNITLIEQESHPLYSRVLLPHYVKGKVLREKVFLKTWEWYGAQRIEVMSGVRVLQIDVKNSYVRTSEEREIPFDVLIVAPGGELNTIGGEPRGVSYLRGIDDADELVALVKETKMRPEEEQRGVVIGGGFIALEYINIFAHFDIACDVVVRGEGFWSKVLSAHAQQVLAQKAEASGVTLHYHEKSPEILGEKDVTGVQLKDGAVLPAAIVGVGIGMHAERSFYEEQGFLVGCGLTVNEFLETSHPNIYAIGDGAEFYDTHVGRVVCYGNWMNAQMQGRAVAQTVLGDRKAFDLVSSYTTNLLSMQMVFIGDVNREHADEVREIFATETTSGEEYYRAGKIVGAVLIGDVAQRAAITARIRENALPRA